MQAGDTDCHVIGLLTSLLLLLLLVMGSGESVVTVQFSPNCTQTSQGIFRLHFRLLFAHWSQAMRFRPRFSHCSFGGAVDPDSARCLQVFQCRMSASLLVGISSVEDMKRSGIRPEPRILAVFQRLEDKSGRRTGERRCLIQFNQYSRQPRLEERCRADTYEIGRVGGGDLNKEEEFRVSQPYPSRSTRTCDWAMRCTQELTRPVKLARTRTAAQSVGFRCHIHHRSVRLGHLAYKIQPQRYYWIHF